MVLRRIGRRKAGQPIEHHKRRWNHHLWHTAPFRGNRFAALATIGHIDDVLRGAIAQTIQIGLGATTVPRDAADNEKTAWLRGFVGSANGNRTRLFALKGRCPNR